MILPNVWKNKKNVANNQPENNLTRSVCWVCPSCLPITSMILIGWRMLKGKPTYKKPLYLEVRTMVSRFPNQNYLHKPWDIQDLRSSDSWGVLDIIKWLDAISCPGMFCCWSEGGNHRDPINASNMGLKRHPLRSMILPEKNAVNSQFAIEHGRFIVDFPMKHAGFPSFFWYVD